MTFLIFHVIKKTFTEASEILRKDFWAMISSENKEINQTVNTQPIDAYCWGCNLANIFKKII